MAAAAAYLACLHSCTLRSSNVAREGSIALLSATNTLIRWYDVLNGTRKAIHGSVQDCKVQDHRSICQPVRLVFPTCTWHCPWKNVGAVCTTLRTSCRLCANTGPRNGVHRLIYNLLLVDLTGFRHDRLYIWNMCTAYVCAYATMCTHRHLRHICA